MAKALGNDLRRRILQAYLQGEGTQQQIALRFKVSLGYVQKILRQYRLTGKMERRVHQPGRKPQFTPPIREQIRSWLKVQPDLTLMELQEKLCQQQHLQVSLVSIWKALKSMGLRLKKSRSTRRSKIASRCSSNAKLFSRR